MKLTKETLKRIIKEELEAVLNESDLDPQSLVALANKLDPEKIANDYEDSVWSWPESIEEDLMYGASGATIRRSGNFKIYEVDRSGEIYAYLSEQAQDGLLRELSKMMNNADPRELASALESSGLLDTMTNKFMDLMLQGNEAVVSVTPEKIVLSDEKLG